jgi:hypothetical protein
MLLQKGPFMGCSKLALSFTTAAAAIILFAGCAGAPSTGPAAGGVLTPTMSQALHPGPPCAIPAVWASQLGPPQVEGYTAAGAAIPCSINNGLGSGKKFTAPFGLASDKLGHLFVADVNRSRVVTFTNVGAWVATLHSKPGFQPRGVCVSPTGIVGAADRGAGGGAGDIEFFTTGLINRPAPTGVATGVDTTFQWCAFDLAGNFFATGSTSTGLQQIVYLPAAQVNIAAGVLVNAGITTVPYWVSMYVQLKCSNTNGEVLAVADLAPEIQFFKINPVSGAPGPVATSILPLTGYPVSSDNMDQDAPDRCSTKATIYFADYGGSELLKTPEYSGAIAVFNPAVSAAVGVATNPTGQE